MNPYEPPKVPCSSNPPFQWKRWAYDLGQLYALIACVMVITLCAAENIRILRTTTDTYLWERSRFLLAFNVGSGWFVLYHLFWGISLYRKKYHDGCAKSPVGEGQEDDSVAP